MLWNSVGDAIKSKSQLAGDENLVCQFLTGHGNGKVLSRTTIQV